MHCWLLLDGGIRVQDFPHLHLMPCSDRGKKQKSAFHRVFDSVLSPQNITGKNRDTGLWAFPEPFSGVIETQMRKHSVLSSTCRIIFS